MIDVLRIYYIVFFVSISLGNFKYDEPSNGTYRYTPSNSPSIPSSACVRVLVGGIRLKIVIYEGCNIGITMKSILRMVQTIYFLRTRSYLSTIHPRPCSVLVTNSVIINMTIIEFLTVYFCSYCRLRTILILVWLYIERDYETTHSGQIYKLACKPRTALWVCKNEKENGSFCS